MKVFFSVSFAISTAPQSPLQSILRKLSSLEMRRFLALHVLVVSAIVVFCTNKVNLTSSAILNLVLPDRVNLLESKNASEPIVLSQYRNYFAGKCAGHASVSSIKHALEGLQLLTDQIFLATSGDGYLLVDTQVKDTLKFEYLENEIVENLTK